MGKGGGRVGNGGGMVGEWRENGGGEAVAGWLSVKCNAYLLYAS